MSADLAGEHTPERVQGAVALAGHVTAGQRARSAAT